MATALNTEWQSLIGALDEVAPQQMQIPPDLLAALDQYAPQAQQQQYPMPDLNLKAEPERGTGGDILHYLDLIVGAPGRAVGGVLEGGSEDRPKDSALRGAWEGLTNKRRTTVADVAGLEEGRSEDTWPDWLEKEGLRFLVNTVTDPLSYVGTPAKGVGLVGKGLKAIGVPEGRSVISAAARKYGGDKALNYLASTKAWAMLGEGAPDTAKLRGLNEIATVAKRKGSTVDLEESALAADAALKKAFPNIDRETLFNAIEDPDSFPELAKAIELYAPVAAEQAKQFERYSGAKEYFTGKAPQKQAGPYVPHISKEAGEWKPRSREIKDFVYEDETGKLNTVFTGKLSDKRTQEVIKSLGDDWYEFHSPTGDIVQVEARPAKLATTKGIVKNIEFEADPIRAQYVSGKGYAKRATFLDMLKGMEKDSYIRKLSPGEELGKGEELLKFPNLELKDRWAAEPAVARNVEQQFGRLYNPDAPLGTISESVANMFGKTAGGQLLKEGTGWWKRNTLAAPGWLTGNASSNAILMYQEGINPLVIPTLMAQARRIQKGTGDEVIKGVANKELLKELKDRGIGKTVFSDEERSFLSGNVAGGKTAERLKSIKVPGPVAGAAQTVGNVAGKWNDLMLRSGGAIENNAKIAVVVDYLKKHASELEKTLPGTEERARLLDRAAEAGHRALIDYSKGTPWETRVIDPIVPFRKWTGGITRRTRDLMVNDPARLARMERLLESAAQPLSQDEKAQADAWVRESAPIKGIFGKRFDKWADELGLPKLPRGERMMLLSRYLPQGNVEQLIARPTDALTSSINPFLKAPYEIATNRNTFKDRPIDQLAETTGSMFTRPIFGGGPYSPATRQNFGTTLPAGYEYLESIAPWGRHANELDMFGQSLGLWGDKYKAEAPSLKEFGPWWLSGGKFYPYDAAKYRKNRARENRETESRIKSAWKWASRQGDSATADRMMQQLSDYRESRSRSYSSGEF